MARLLSFLRHQGGSAAAEMALVLPMLFALTFAMFEGANYAWTEHRVVMAVRDGARYAGRLDFSYYACPAGTFVDSGGKLAQIQNLTRTGQLTGGNAKVQGWTNGDVQVTVSCASSQSGLYTVTGGYAPRVTVSTKIAYPSLLGSLGIPTSMQIGASAQAAVMGL